MIKPTIVILALAAVAFPQITPVVGFSPGIRSCNSNRVSPRLTCAVTTGKNAPSSLHTFSSLHHMDQYLQLTRKSSSTAVWMAEEEEEEKNEEKDLEADAELSPLQKLKRKLFPPKPDDGLTFKKRLAKAGLSVVLSYGWVSNVSYSITVSIAWFLFSKRTGLSPLAPGQWKPFLAVYAGFYVFNNFIRPARFALSMGVSAYFDRFVKFIQDKFRVNKGVAIFLTVFLANVVGTIALMCTGITLASMAAGVPVFPPKA